eukprot:Hpha_TRINITY_DN10973_c0_g1::TRINITY_DN10973_c0_g1_i1::g.26756::m.26756
MSSGMRRTARKAGRVRTESMIDRLGKKDLSEGIDLWDRDYLLGALRLFQCKEAVGPPFEVAICLDSMGEILSTLGEEEEAAEYFELAASKYGLIGRRVLASLMQCKLAGSVDGPAAALAELDAALTDSDRALRAGQAVKLDANLARLYLFRGQLLGSMGEIEAALSALDTSIAMKPERLHVALFARGNLLEQSGRADEAVQSYKRATDYKPTFVPGLEALARLLADLERRTEARGVLDTAYRHHPKASIVREKAFAVSATGRDVEALRILDDALKKPPTGDEEEASPAAVLHKAKAAIYGDIASQPGVSAANQGTAIHDGLRELDKALKIDPADTEAQHMKEQIQALKQETSVERQEKVVAAASAKSNDRVAAEGDLVRLKGNQEGPAATVITKCASTSDVWVLDNNHSAVVVSVDPTGLVQLRNADGMVSGWQEPSLFKLDRGGLLLKGRPMAQSSMSPKRQERVHGQGITTYLARQVTEQEVEVEHRDRMVRIGDLIQSRKGEDRPESVFIPREGGGGWMKGDHEASLVVEVARDGRFRVRGTDGSLSQFLPTADFQFSDGGHCLAAGEKPRTRLVPTSGLTPTSPDSRLDRQDSDYVEPTLPRIPRVGDHVLTRDQDEFVTKLASGYGTWFIEGGHAAVVAEVNVSGDLKLRNSDGLICDWQDPTLFRFENGAKCVRGATTASMRRPFSPPRKADRDHAPVYTTNVLEAKATFRKEKSRVASLGEFVQPRTEGENTDGGITLRRADGGAIWAEDHAHLLVVGVEPGTGRLKLRTTSGDLTDWLDPNEFKFESGGVCLREGQGAAAVKKAPIVCTYKPPPPALVEVVPTREEPKRPPAEKKAALYQPEEEARNAAAGGPDKVDAWQQKIAAQREKQPPVHKGWESDDEAREDPVAAWQARHQTRQADGAPDGWDSDDERPTGGSGKRPSPGDAAEAAPQESSMFIVTRRSDGKLGIVSGKTTAVKVTPGSAAEAAGLRSGMVIMAVDGAVVASGPELMSKLRGAGQKVSILIKQKAAASPPKAVDSPPPRAAGSTPKQRSPGATASAGRGASTGRVPSAGRTAGTASTKRPAAAVSGPGSPPKIVNRPGAPTKPGAKRATVSRR